jgi:DNA-directed RNA polymerase specialized sigma24 family protein
VPTQEHFEWVATVVADLESVARSVAGRFTRPGHPDHDDVLQEARIGIWLALLDFDPSRDVQLGAIGFVAARRRLGRWARKRSKCGFCGARVPVSRSAST